MSVAGTLGNTAVVVGTGLAMCWTGPWWHGVILCVCIVAGHVLAYFEASDRWSRR